MTSKVLRCYAASVVALFALFCGIARAQSPSRSPWARIYIGTMDGFRPYQRFALYLRDDGTGVFLPGAGSQGELAFGGRRQWFEVFVGQSGRFELGAPNTAYWFTGQIDASGRLSGTIRFPTTPNLDVQTFSATRSAATGPATKYAGYYRGMNDGPTFVIDAAGNVYVLVGSELGGYGYGGGGTVDANGNLRAQASFRLTFNGRVADDASAINGFSGILGSNTGPILAVNENAPVPRRLVNMSARVRIAAADAPPIFGFVLAGEGSSEVLLRAIGPGLANFGVVDPVANPRLELYQGSRLIGTNSGWSSTGGAADIAAAAAATGAFPLASGSADSAMKQRLAADAYTAIVSGGSGAALAEIYELPATPPTTALANLSARVVVRPGDGETMLGFVIDGTLPKKVIVRAVGPSLAAFGISGFLPRPALTLFSGNQPLVSGMKPSETPTAVAAAAQAGAFPLTVGAADEVLLVDLAPGNYAARVTSGDGASGVALVEIYAVP
jgi:hypothetical protein